MKVNREFVIIFFIKMCIRTSLILRFLQYGPLVTDDFLFAQIVRMINSDVFHESKSLILVKDVGTE